MKIMEKDLYVKLPYYTHLKSPTSLTFEIQIPKSSNKYLYIPQIDASYIEILANNTTILKKGYSSKAGHFFYTPYFIPLPPKISTLKIKLSGVYEIGIEFPIYVVDESQKYKFWILNFLTFHSTLILIGIFISLSIILYLLSKSTTSLNKKKIFHYFSLSSIFASIWIIDLLPISDFESIQGFLKFKKLFIISLYLGYSFLLKGSLIFFYYLNKLGNFLVYAFYFMALLLLFQTNILSLHLLHNYFSVIFIISSIFLLYLYFKKKTQNYYLFFILTLFILTTIHDTIILLFDIESKLLSPIGGMILFFVFSYIILYEYKSTTIEKEKLYEKSLKDNLTGAFNRNIFEFENFSSEDVFIYIDINKLKEINDTFGHKTGDKILVKFSQTVKQFIRKNDLLIRLGGDEFLLVLKNCSKRKGKKIINNILKKFKQSDKISPAFSWGITKFDKSVEKTLENVDILMYKMKLKRK
ncbi:diguanylate cyclase [Thermosipho melanesiensis]|nr:diguanylate cyclase [Thermosipho melanesiensis]